MAHAGQEIHGPDGFRLRLIRTAAETDGDLLEMEATYGGTGSLPAGALPSAPGRAVRGDRGSIRAIIDGTERRYAPGETFDVPAGTPHQMTADEPSRMRWEIRPALRTAEFFEQLYATGDIAALLAEFRDEVRLTALEQD